MLLLASLRPPHSPTRRSRVVITRRTPHRTMASIEEIDDNFSDPDDMVLDDVAAPVEARATGLRPPLMAGGPGLAGQAGYKQVEQHVYKE